MSPAATATVEAPGSTRAPVVSSGPVALPAPSPRLSVRGADRWSDAHAPSPGGERLLTVFGAEHAPGVIPASAGMPETAAAAGPAPGSLVPRTTTASLLAARGLGDEAWTQARAARQDAPRPLGRRQSR